MTWWRVRRGRLLVLIGLVSVVTTAALVWAQGRREPRAPTWMKAHFAGPYRWSTFDSDSSGTADQLVLEGVIDVDSAPWESTSVGALVGLYKDHTFITAQPGQFFQADYQIRRLGVFSNGRHPFSVAFGGEAIRHSGLDGPYVARLELFPDAELPKMNTLDTIRVSSPAYAHQDFGEYGLNFRSARERPLDTDGDGLYDSLRITVRFDRPPLKPWAVRVDAESLDDHVARFDGGEAIAAAGDSTANVTLDGTQIHRLRRDGPYTFSVAGGKRGFELRTRPYRWKQFGPPAITLIEGPLHAHGSDPSTNGAFGSLVVMVPVMVRRTGNYTCSAQLQTGTNLGAGASWGDSLTAGTRRIPLRFPACELARSRHHGPCTLTRIEVRDARDRRLVGPVQARTVEVFKGTQFQSCPW